MTVLILALLVVNIVLTSVMLVSIVGTNKKTAQLVDNITTAMNLELTVPGDEETTNVALTDTEVYNIADSMTIPLKSEAGAKQDYIMFDVSLSINKKHKDYKTYGSSDTLASYENLIKDAITATVSAHTEDECREDMEGLKEGLKNLDKHIENLQSFGQTVVVAFNRYANDTDEELDYVRQHCAEKGIGFAINNAFMEGGEGAVDLANLVVDTIEKQPSKPLTFAYDETDSVEEKVRKIALNLYGAKQVLFGPAARKKLKMIEELGYTHFPICIAKTQYSFSTDPKLYGVASGFNFTVRDIVINAGAEMLVMVAGEIMRMPGLPKEPQALHIDIVNGEIEGLS